LAVIASYCRWAGFTEITVVDANLLDDEGIEQVFASKPELLGVTSWIGSVPPLDRFREALGSNVPIIVGGAFPTVVPQYHLDKGADIIVAGNGKPFVDILRHLQKGGQLADLPKVMSSTDSTVDIPDLRSVYGLFHINGYADRWPDNRRGMMAMYAPGCPYGRCPFCTGTYLGAPQANIDRFRNDVFFLQSEYAITDVYFGDSMLPYDSKEIALVCRIFAEAGLSWFAETRPETISRETVRMLASSNCRRILLGLESASAKISRQLKGNKSVTHVREAINLLRASGVEPQVFVLFGLPGETDGSLKETLDFLEKEEVVASPNILFPIPGTAIWHKAEAGNLLPSFGEYINRMREYDKADRCFVPVSGLCDVPDELLVEAVRSVWRHNKVLKKK
jgi:radical SAM superfamily enzyme YgiQ (UPF0313 family)